MQLNRFEKSIVRHPLRLWLQRQLERRMLLKLFAKPLPAFSRALEIGCGFGEGIALVRQDLGAEEVWALDFDFDMVSHCAGRYSDQNWLHLCQGDGSTLPFADSQFDLVVDFAAFHHIPDWQQAVAEVHRVLRPGGYFVMEELYRFAICNPLSRRLFEHPQENRFNHAELLAVLEDSGNFEIIRQHQLPALAGIILARKTVGKA
ncbi:MAG: class I SAM-dependent methyltransferase [Shewanella algae]